MHRALRCKSPPSPALENGNGQVFHICLRLDKCPLLLQRLLLLGNALYRAQEVSDGVCVFLNIIIRSQIDRFYVIVLDTS